MASDGLRIWLFPRPKSGILVIRFQDPQTGKVVQKSTGTTNRREAERQLGELRADLAKDRYEKPSTISWEAFRRRYEDEHMPSLAEKTRLKVATVLNAVEKTLRPNRLRDLSAERLSDMQKEFRDGGLSENTIAGYLAHLHAALAWAVKLGFLHRVPNILRPKRAKGSTVTKGRPITDAEFELMIAATKDVVGDEAAASWKHYLRGLNFSGLRLAESLELFWDDESKLCVICDGNGMLLRIPAELEKGHKDRQMAMAPEFVDFLLQTPRELRKGRVFKLKAQKVRGERMTADRVSQVVAAIGKKAGVVVDTKRNKFASAHDLRRSFGERWASRVMPPTLMELMRHESIETTLKFYVGRNAERTSKLLREAYEQHLKQTSRDTLRDTPSLEDENVSE